MFIKSLRFILILMVFLAAAATHADEGIGLVLGGGGARGAAHVGVLKVLERERIPVSYIAGTSVGSFVGGLYAAGYSADEIEAIIIGIDWKDMFRDDSYRQNLPMRRKDEDLRYLLNFKMGIRKGRLVFPRGVLQGQKLLLLLRRLTLPVWEIDHFDHLPIPFRCIGTDIGSGESMIFKEGDLALAIRASMSVPAAYAPILVDERLIVDGGIVNNVPIDVAQAMGAHRLIAVNVQEPLTKTSELNSPLSISNQMLTILMKDRTDSILARMHPDDVLITPQLGDFSSVEFDRSAEAIAQGEAAAMKVIAELRQFSVTPEQYAAYRAHRQRPIFNAPILDFIEVAKNRSSSPQVVANSLKPLIGKPLDSEAIEAGIANAYGNGRYEGILWTPESKDGKTGIKVTPVDKGWGPNFLTFGLQLNDDFQGRSNYQLSAEGTFVSTGRHDGETRLRLDIGGLAGIRAERYQPFGNHDKTYVLPHIDYRVENQLLQFGDRAIEDYRVRRFVAGALLGYNISTDWRIESGLLWGENTARVLPSDDSNQIESDYGALTLGFSHDSLDDSDFPTSGGRTDLTLQAHRAKFGSDGNGEVLRVRTDQALSWDRHRWLFGVRAHTTYGNADPLQSLDSLGGLGQLSGYAERELVGQHSFLARVVYYARFGDASKLFSLPAYGGVSLEAGNVGNRRRDISINSLIVAGSLFLGLETPFGPMFLGYGQADSGERSLYLTFGSLLGGQR